MSDVSIAVVEDKIVAGKKKRSEVIEQYRKEKLAAMKARQVRVTFWSDNDKLYSGQPSINLLTRANLHLPKVFEGVQTMASRIGALPNIEFDTKPEGDANAPELMKALFNEDMDDCDAHSVAQASKIEAGLYGRAVYKVIPRDDGASVELVDTLAFLINPTARSTRDLLYGGQQFIYKTIHQIEDEADRFKYDKDVIDVMKAKKVASDTPAANTMEKSLKDLRASYLGYSNVSQTGADMAELTEWYTSIDGEDYVLTVADDTYLLRAKKPQDVGIPKKHPYRSWATFPRGVAFWTPSVADVLRDPNLAMDVTLNQMIDNNTYRNFGMMFVDSSSGLKQSAIIPRPLGIISISTGAKSIHDSVLPYTPPEINDAQQTLLTLNSMAENAVGLSGTPPGHKGKMSVTQQASSMALIEGKTNMIRQNFLNCWREIAELYAETMKLNHTKPRKAKVYGQQPVTLNSITRDNYKDVDFIAKSTAAELSQENKAIRQKAAIEMYNLFKDDPMIPGQKKLRERVAKEFDLTPQDMGDLFTQTPDDAKHMQMIAAAKAAESGGGGDIPANPDNPQLSANGKATAANVPQAIR